EQNGDGALVLHLIQSSGLRNTNKCRGRNRARVLLVEMRPVEVGAESQALDRGPDRVDTDHSQVEVRIAGAGQGKQRNHVGADRALGSATVLNRTIRTVDGARPVRVPVVGVTTAEAPGLDRLTEGVPGRSRTVVHDVRNAGDAEALIRTSQSSATVHRVRLRIQALEVVAACTIRINGLQV